MITSKKYFNPEGCEILNERIFAEQNSIADNNTGFIDFNRSRYKWAKDLYDMQINRFWTPQQVNIANEKKNFSALSYNEKEIYKRVFAQLSFNDSIQTNYLADLAPKANNQIARISILKQMESEILHCYIAGTEVLTSNGFKDFRDLKYSDKVANYQEDGTITFSEPTDIINSKYNGKMYKFEQTNYCQIVTPNHRMVMRYSFYPKEIKRERAGNLRIIQAEEAYLGGYDLPIAGRAVGKKITLTDIEKLAIAFQADGWYMNKEFCDKHGYDFKTYRLENGLYSYQFQFKRADKISRLESLLKDGKIHYSKKIRDNGYTVFYINSPMLFDKEFRWVNLSDISASWGEEFIQELQYWDGSKRDNESVVYANSNREAIDKVVEIASLSGSQTGIYYIDPKKSKGHNLIDSWQVHIVPNKPNKTGREIKKTEIDYDGTIHCCTVESGMLICRYKESVFVSGNSNSYAFLLDNVGNSNEVFDLYKTEDTIAHKNQRIAEMYARHINGETAKDLLMASMASVCLEGIFFLSGFSYIFSMGEKVQGSGDMLAEIAVDEVAIHLPMFANMCNTIVRENNFGAKEKDEMLDILMEGYDIEIEYSKSLADYPILGITPELVENTLQNFVNDRAKILGLELPFEDRRDTSLQKLITDRVQKRNEAKTNFFEGNVRNYSIGSIELDDF